MSTQRSSHSQGRGRPVVFHLVDTLRAGGSEQSLAEPTPSYADAGLRLTVFRLNVSAGESVREVELEGSEVRELRGSTLPGKVLEFGRLGRRERPDVVHTMLFYPGLVGRLAAIGTRVPVLTSLVNTTYSRARWDDPNIDARKLRLLQILDSYTGRCFTSHFRLSVSSWLQRKCAPAATPLSSGCSRTRR